MISEKKDYLMIRIEQLGKVLGKILSLISGVKTEGNVSDIYEFVDESLKNETDITLEIILYSNNNDIREILKNSLYEDAGLYEKFSDILAEIAERTEDIEKQTELYERSLLILKISEEISCTFSFEKQTKINILRQIINYKKK